MAEGRVLLRIPAVALNVGAGYQALGLALTLHNEFKVETTGEAGVRVTNLGPYAREIPASEGNLVARAARRVFEAAGETPPGLHVTATCNIPPRRGLAASATAVVAGLAAASRLARAPLDRSDICALASEFDERPEAVAAALFGGAQLSVTTGDGCPLCAKLPFPEGLEMILAIPEVDISSREARVGYPRQVSLENAVHNGGRVGLLVAALFTGDVEFLVTGLEDRIHLPLVRQRIPAFGELSLLARSGAFGLAVCGYGPSLLLFHRGDGAALAVRVRDAFRRARMAARVLNVTADRKGTQFLDG